MKRKKLFYKAMAGALLASMLVTGTPAAGEIAALIGADSLTMVAQAVSGSCYELKNGVLTLKGNVSKDEMASFEQKEKVTSIVASDGTIFPENCGEIFIDFSKCESIDLTKADTGNVANMCGFFRECSSLKTLKLPDNFVTNKVQDTSYMFYNCSSLTELDLSTFDTGNVSQMNNMFGRCHNLKSLNVSGFKTDKVTDMGEMFRECNSLEELDVSGFKTGKVTDMRQMFYQCNSLEELDVSSFDTGNVTDMSSMFEGCGGLSGLDLSGFKTEKVTSMRYMFSSMHGVKKLDLSSFDTSSTKDFSGMFFWNPGMEELNLSSFKVSEDAAVFKMFTAIGQNRLKSTFILGPKFTKVTSDMELPSYDTWTMKDGEMVRLIKQGDPVEFENTGLNTYYHLSDVEAEGGISGVTRYGYELECSVNDGNVQNYAYQWRRGTTAISGATKRTYTLQKEDIGCEISCVVTDADGVCIGQVIFGSTEVVKKARCMDLPSELQGVAPTRLGGNDGKITGVSAAMEYSQTSDFASKTKCTGTEINNLEAGTYYVRFAESDTHESSRFMDVVVEDGPADLTGKVSLTGNAVCGEKLTAVVSDTNSSAFEYVWKRGKDKENLEVISGANESSYVLTTEDIGTYVFCFVSDASGKTIGTIDGRTTSVIAKKTDPVTEVFTDVKPDAWYVKAVQFVYDNGIMKGKDGKFDPKAPVTRAEFSQVLYNEGGKPDVDLTAFTFADVKTNGWYAKAVIWAKSKDIANGYRNGKFGVSDSIQREQIALMLYKYAKFKGIDVTVNTNKISEYADSNKISEWATTAMEWAIDRGIMSGKGKSGDPISTFKLDPKGNATRAECASMVKNFKEKLVK